FNYAKISPETWKSAQTVTTRIFDQTEIETACLDCSLSPEGHFMLPECGLPPHPTDIVLRLVPTSAATRTHFGDETLGIPAPAQTSSGSSDIVNSSDFRKSEATLLEASVPVYNYPDVSPEVLAKTEKRAEAVKLVWVDSANFRRRFHSVSQKAQEERDSLDVS